MRALLEVRCCCQPQKLLGWLWVPDDRLREFYLPLMVSSGEFDFSITPTSTCFEQVRLQIAQFRPDPLSDSYKAVKAEGLSVETLRRLRGFTEA